MLCGLRRISAGWSCFPAEVGRRPSLLPVLIPSCAHPGEWVQGQQPSPADARTSHASPAMGNGVSPGRAAPASSLLWPFRGSSTSRCGSGPCQVLSVRRASLWLRFKLSDEDCFPWPVGWHAVCLGAGEGEHPGICMSSAWQTSLLV